MEILRDAGFIIGSYLVGAIPFCYILGKMISGKKLTEIGDKNPGGWNLVFNVSKIWGFLGIILDMAKGYFAYYLAYKFTSAFMLPAISLQHNELIAIIAGCASVAGHNYSPYMKFKGGKGIATWGGLVIASHYLALPFGAVSHLIGLLIGAAGLLVGLFLARNMIWAVGLGIVFAGVSLWIFESSFIFGIMAAVLLIIMIPKQVNRNIPIGINFKFRKEASLGDLFKPKVR
ncbi:MAG: glycerol-3-phosphate acyltransferase [Actinobacteria bacterium]|nr:glycerol-3-phosphate acyltransferase [Actinomycetota bacterium]